MLKTFSKTFRKCASGWGNSKKVKMLKNGGSYVCVSMPCAQTWFPPSLTFLPFLEFPQSEAHFRKKKKKRFNISPARSTFHFFFNFSPARSTFHFLFLTFPQPEREREREREGIHCVWLSGSLFFFFFFFFGGGVGGGGGWAGTGLGIIESPQHSTFQRKGGHFSQNVPLSAEMLNIVVF